jgi:hypothetical protein
MKINYLKWLIPHLIVIFYKFYQNILPYEDPNRNNHPIIYSMLLINHYWIIHERQVGNLWKKIALARINKTNIKYLSLKINKGE